MRLGVLSCLLFACSKDPQPAVDASVVLADAKPIDAPVDAPSPDAPNMNVVTACMHICDAVFACFRFPPDPSCYAECAVDLADCSAEEVTAIDACSTEECGDLENEDSPMVDCITQVRCVDAAVSRPSR
jgi:hypothetical protein